MEKIINTAEQLSTAFVELAEVADKVLKGEAEVVELDAVLNKYFNRPSLDKATELEPEELT